MCTLPLYTKQRYAGRTQPYSQMAARSDITGKYSPYVAWLEAELSFAAKFSLVRTASDPFHTCLPNEGMCLYLVSEVVSGLYHNTGYGDNYKLVSGLDCGQ